MATERLVAAPAAAPGLALAVAVVAPETLGTAVIATLAEAPTGSVPTAQLTLEPLTAHDPWLAVAEGTETPLGSGLVTWTFVATAGPRLVTVRAYGIGE